MRRPIAVPRWAVYVLLFGLYLTVRGYHSRDGDQAYRLPLFLHGQDPALYAGDPFVRAFDAFNPHRGYFALIGLASWPFGLSAGLFGLFAATFALTCAGIDRLARAVWPDRGSWVGGIAVGLVLLAKAGNVGTNHLFEAILLDRLIGFALGWMAIALAVEGETWRPSLLIGLATVIHPTVGLQLGGLIGASWLAWAIGRRWTGFDPRSAMLGLVSIAIAALPGALPAILQGGRLFEGLSPGEFRLLGVELQMAQHMLPSLWRMPQWVAWGSYILLGMVSVVSGRGADGPEVSRDGIPGGSWVDQPPDRTSRARFAILCGVLLCGLGVATVGVEWVGNLRLTVFQPFRMATIARGLALIALSGRCRDLWASGGVWGKARVMILGAGLAGDWSFVVAAAVEVAATISGRVVIPAAVFLIGLVFLARHDTEQGQWALAMAAALGIVFHLMRTHFAPGWTARRLRWAFVSCVAVPVSAFVAGLVGNPGHPIVRALVERCRFGAIPTDDIERLAVWARDRTPTDARFVTPPGPKTFRLWSGRAVAFNRAASPYHAEGLKDWADRFRAHVGDHGPTAEFVRSYLADRHGWESRYGRFDADDLARLADDQGADHVVAAPNLVGAKCRLEPLWIEGRYALYRVIPLQKDAQDKSSTDVAD